MFAEGWEKASPLIRFRCVAAPACMISYFSGLEKSEVGAVIRVMRSCSAPEVIAPLVPAFAAVRRPPEATFAPGKLDRGVDHARVLLRNGQSDLALVSARQTTLQFSPRFPTVDRLVNPGLRSAIDQGPHRAMTLVGGGVEDGRILRIAYKKCSKSIKRYRFK